MTMSWTTYSSPLGVLTLVGSDRGLRNVFYPDLVPMLDPDTRDPGVFSATTEQFDRYFSGDSETIDVPLELEGTEFQRTVWSLVAEIPYGETTSYGQLASRLTDIAPGATASAATVAQVVAWAIAKTPTPIVVPCHRVIGADGTMKGYLGGIPRKQALLRFETAGGDPHALADRWAPIGKQQRLALK